MPGWEIGYGRVLGFAMVVLAAVGALLSTVQRRAQESVTGKTGKMAATGVGGKPPVGRRYVREAGKKAREQATQAGGKVSPIFLDGISRVPNLVQTAVAATRPVLEEVSARAPQMREQLGVGASVLATGGKRALELQQRVTTGFVPAGQKGLETAQKGAEMAATAARDAVETVRQSVIPQLGEVLNKAQPAVTSAVSEGVSRVRGEGVDILKSTGSGASEMMRGAASSMAETAEEMQRKTTSAVKSGASAAASTTREVFGIFFWLAALAGVIMFVFIENQETRARVWGYINRASTTVMNLADRAMGR
ncbi:MAG: hypothetical protein M1319_02835 [Chloroflexi bacterium]|nr:hypothetical protein [Chloroflexota bacterium]